METLQRTKTGGGVVEESGLEWMLDVWVRIKTVNDEEFEGKIFAFDPVINCLAIECAHQPTHTQYPRPSCTTSTEGITKRDYRIIKTNCIKEVTPLGESNGWDVSTFATVEPAVGPVPIDRIKGREKRAIQETWTSLSRIGVGVTREAQEIFDALSKTLPCRWHKDTIIVLDEVVIRPPYTAESCLANAPAAGTLARVQKVLEGERQRMAAIKK
ncbi:uncharacterized protein VTP21DRAFT_7061 [Calcarisporiella thermophila]|uniref:uncharacterized protein n=1 Tax=Calcarisporiella thermophila TaxID=911321 RepID=UPI003742CAE2